MNCKIIVIDGFKRDAKKLLKKYASLKEEFLEATITDLRNIVALLQREK
jgi:hypothetical protein